MHEGFRALGLVLDLDLPAHLGADGENPQAPPSSPGDMRRERSAIIIARARWLLLRSHSVASIPESLAARSCLFDR